MSSQLKVARTVGRDGNYFESAVVLFEDNSFVRVWRNGERRQNWRSEGGTTQYISVADIIVVGSIGMRRGPTVRVTSAKNEYGGFSYYAATEGERNSDVAFVILPDWAYAQIPGDDNLYISAALLEDWIAAHHDEVVETLRNFKLAIDAEEARGGFTHRVENPFRRLLEEPLRKIAQTVQTMQTPAMKLLACRTLAASDSTIKDSTIK